MSSEDSSSRGDSEVQDNSDNKMIEIERKFVVSDDTRERIVNKGGKLHEEMTLSDSYFDTENYSLTQKDYWLRRRNDTWELKMPPANRKDDSACTQYQEVTSEEAILNEVAAILKCSSATGTDDVVNGNESKQIQGAGSVEQLIQRQGLEPFAVFTTQRKNFVFDGGITVTIDEADFGFSVGEIEIMVASNSEEINAAISKIANLGKELGMEDFCSLSSDRFLSAEVIPIISNSM